MSLLWYEMWKKSRVKPHHVKANHYADMMCQTDEILEEPMDNYQPMCEYRCFYCGYVIKTECRKADLGRIVSDLKSCETSKWQTNSFPRPLPHAPYHTHHPFHNHCKSCVTLATMSLKTKVNWEVTRLLSFTGAIFALRTLEVKEACKHTYETNMKSLLSAQEWWFRDCGIFTPY